MTDKDSKRKSENNGARGRKKKQDPSQQPTYPPSTYYCPLPHDAESVTGWVESYDMRD